MHRRADSLPFFRLVACHLFPVCNLVGTPVTEQGEAAPQDLGAERARRLLVVLAAGGQPPMERLQLGVIVAGDLRCQIRTAAQHGVSVLGDRLVRRVGAGTALQTRTESRERDDFVGTLEPPRLADERGDGGSQEVSESGHRRQPGLRVEFSIQFGDPLPERSLRALLGLQQIEVLIDQQLQIVVAHREFGSILDHLPQSSGPGFVELSPGPFAQQRGQPPPPQTPGLRRVQVPSTEQQRGSAVTIPEHLLIPGIDHQHPGHDPALPVGHLPLHQPGLPHQTPQHVPPGLAHVGRTQVDVHQRQPRHRLRVDRVVLRVPPIERAQCRALRRRHQVDRRVGPLQWMHQLQPVVLRRLDRVDRLRVGAPYPSQSLLQVGESGPPPPDAE